MKIRMMTAAAALALLSSRAPAPARADDVRANVEAANRAFIAAFLSGNSQTIATLYTADAKVIGPGNEIAQGSGAIAAFWQKAIDSGVKDVKLTTAMVESAGDLAYEDGTVTLVGADGRQSTSRYVVVWKRDAGTWKLHRDIWN